MMRGLIEDKIGQILSASPLVVCTAVLPAQQVHARGVADAVDLAVEYALGVLVERPVDLHQLFDKGPNHRVQRLDRVGRGDFVRDVRDLIRTEGLAGARAVAREAATHGPEQQQAHRGFVMFHEADDAQAV